MNTKNTHGLLLMYNLFFQLASRQESIYGESQHLDRFEETTPQL